MKTGSLSFCSGVAGWMPDRIRVDCFVEDEAHEILLRAVLERFESDLSLEIVPRFPSARGGAAQAQLQFRAYQGLVRQRREAEGAPDLLILAVDCDCRPSADCRRMIDGNIDPAVFPESVSARPHSHVEAWYMADPESFYQVVGAEPPPHDDPCEPDVHKQRLRQAVRAGGHAISNGGLEFGPDLVEAMNFARVRRAEQSLDDFIGELRAALRRIKAY